MPNMIEFKSGERDVFDRDAIQFLANVDGQRVSCLVSHEALQDRFGASSNGLLGTFQLNRSSIEAVAAKLIENAKVANGELLITSRDFGSRG
jgi:hypothetical protein